MPFYYGNILFPSPTCTDTSLHRYHGFLRKNKRLCSVSFVQEFEFGQSIAFCTGFGGGGGSGGGGGNELVVRRTSMWEKLFTGGLDTSILWTRKTSKFASISVGVRHDSSVRSFIKKNNNNGGSSSNRFPHQKSGGYGCLAWLFRIQRGEFNLDIPISFVNDNIDIGGGGGLVGYMMHGLYLGFVSFLIDAAIGDLFGNKGRFMNMISSSSSEDEEKGEEEEEQQRDLRKEERLLKSHAAKAREDAERQAQLMSRQASIKKRAEDKKDGLVIVKAIYMIGDDGRNGSGESSSSSSSNEENQKDGKKRSVIFDVTTQLQFWVVDSKLQLPCSSKSQMLGFYDLTMEYLHDDNDNDLHGGESAGFFFVGGAFRKWWQKHWLVDSGSDNVYNNTSRSPVPFLKVEYKLGGQVYRIMVRDDEPLILPNATATLVDV